MIGGGDDESESARLHARRAGLAHRVIDVRWSDALAAMDALMLRKGAPLHPLEVPLHVAAVFALATEFW